MAGSKSTKRALTASIGCLALCVVMLIGTTFAWFTDTATTGVNQITSGKLKVSIVDKNGGALTNGLTFENMNGSSDILWEPNASFKTQAFKVKNDGNLALQYKFELNGVTGDEGLVKAIEFSVVDKDGHEVSLDKFAGNLNATDETSDVYYIKGHMLESAGNEYQGMTLTGISLAVSATQYTYESDSYGNNYDANAKYATPVSTVDALKDAIAAGKDVVLNDANLEITNDISTSDILALEVNSDTTIYGSGTTTLSAEDPKGGSGRVINVNDNTNPVTLTLSGVNIVGPTTNSFNRGISAYGNTDVSIVMDNCTASANHYALNIATENKKATVSARNSSLTGYSAFQTSSPNTTATFENCTLTGWNQWDFSTNAKDKESFGNSQNDYAVVKLSSDAEKSNLTFKNCLIEAKMTGTAMERILSASSGASGTVTFEGCTFYVTDNEGNTVQLTTEDEILEWVSVPNSVTVTIK